MSTHTTYVQVPPQSTGRKVATEERTIIDYDGLTGTINVGDTVTGATSGATGVVTANVTVGFAANEGRLFLNDSTGTFTDNENLEISSSPVANVNVATNVQETVDMQHMVIVDPNNPTHQQKIDRFGATVNTFADGSPSFSPFGGLLVAQQQSIKDYRFGYSGLDLQFYDQETSGGSVSWDGQTGNILFSCPTTSGAIAERTSNFYHPYVPGVGQLIEMTLQIGDTGKSNVRRRWGYFDDNDGVFFELDGTSLYIVVRSSTAGDSSIQETRIAQADWNADPLDGSDAIGFSLDVSKSNIYYIDLQWLGAGRVRFGVVDSSGEKLTAHVVENSNISNLPYMRTATLPLRISQENTGTSASTSEFRWACATVKHTNKVIIAGLKHSVAETNYNITDTDGEEPVVGLRPRQTFLGRTNRGIIRATDITLSVDSGGQPCLFRFRGGLPTSLPTAASWADHNTAQSLAQIDTSATAITPASTQLGRSYILQPGETLRVENLQSQEVHTGEIFLNADGTTQPDFYITVEALTTGSSDVHVAINWEEILH